VNQKKKLKDVKPKMTYIISGKNLLTLVLIYFMFAY